MELVSNIILGIVGFVVLVFVIGFVVVWSEQRNRKNKRGG
ncbi:hypothetical protein ES705_36233 [subsurface metagenome]